MSDNAQVISAVQEEIDKDADFAIALAQKLVRIPSVNPRFVDDPAVNREADVQAVLNQALIDEGFATEQWEISPGRPNLIGEKPGTEDRSLILCGHVDVVPVGEISRWDFDPFGGEISNGRLHGRGAADMKGGLVACIAATRALRKLGVDLEGRLAFHAVVDEEAGGQGAIDAVAKGKLAKAMIVAEPTAGIVKPAEGGLEWVRVTIRGRSAHSGWRFNEIFPQADLPGRRVPGVNAIDLSTRFLEALRHYEAGRCRACSHPLMPPGLNTINPGVIRGGSGLGPDGLPAIMTNPAIIPDTVVIDLDMKFLPNETSAQVRADFEAFVANFAKMDLWMRDHPPTVQWELGGLHFPPMDTPVDHPIVQSLLSAGSALGLEPRLRGLEAVCDAAHYAQAGVAGVVFGPTGDGIHGDNEYLDLASLGTTAKIIASAVIDWCGVR